MILYEDNSLIVCHKPAGIPVQSSRVGKKDMVSILNNYLAEKRMEEQGRQKNTEPEQIHVVHRLDQPVEGVIVFAKTKQAAAELTRQITQGSMKKIYQAVCCVTDQAREGILAEDADSQFHLENYLVKNGRTNTSQVVKKGTKDAKYAELYMKVPGRSMTGGLRSERHPEEARIVGETGLKSELNPERGREYLLVEIELKTGRHHQIRVQMAHVGLPLYGDQKYNEEWQSFALQERPSLALCAISLGFQHPVTGKNMTFKTEPSQFPFR